MNKKMENKEQLPIKKLSKKFLKSIIDKREKEVKNQKVVNK
tara:strand:- start:1904 stop:2026 length:123 start_codon:yes stop_codon:yes gene_type:complete